jgi:hypothetical protein
MKMESKYDEKKDKHFTFANAGLQMTLRIERNSTLLKLRWLNRGTGLMRIQILHTRIEP